jgi:hypothetical protein
MGGKCQVSAQTRHAQTKRAKKEGDLLYQGQVAFSE